MTDVFIKICGMTSATAVDAAMVLEVDAIGFVFAPSVRRVTPEQAAQLSRSVPRSVLKIAVTQHPDQALSMRSASGLTGHLADRY